MQGFSDSQATDWYWVVAGSDPGRMQRRALAVREPLCFTAGVQPPVRVAVPVTQSAASLSGRWDQTQGTASPVRTAGPQTQSMA